MTISEKAFGRDHPEVARTLNGLATLYVSQSRYGDAEPLYRRSLAIREKALGSDHPDIAQLLNNMALLYLNQRRYPEVESVYQRSLAIREKALGRDHPVVAVSLNNLAGLYRRQGRYGDALPIIRRTLLQRTANKTIAFPVLLAAEQQNLLDAASVCGELRSRPARVRLRSGRRSL